MDSAELLDLLGNENRRRILELLSHKPCYVTEISEYIGVSPKAVIDHLELLEDAGMIENRVDDRRRKYFYITRNLRLEVNVSPYSFGVKSAYPRPNYTANYEHVSIEARFDDSPDEVSELIGRLEELQTVEKELSIAQRHVQSQITEVMSEIEEALEDGEETEMRASVLATLLESPLPTARLASEFGVDEDEVLETLEGLEDEEAVEPDGDDIWRLTDR
jgi:ArsR family transcriptional regulator